MAQEISADEAVGFVKQVRELLAINPANAALGHHRLNLLDSMRLVPTYSGDENVLPLDKFWEIFQNNAKYFNWGKEDQLFALNNKLSGRALALVEIHKQPNSTVEEIIQILRDRFAVKKVESEILADFFSFKQPDYMSVEDFIAEAKKRVKQVSKILDISDDKKQESEEKWVRNMLFKNLNDNIRRGVIARNPLSLKDLEAAAKSEELAWIATKSSGTFSNGAASNLNPFAQEFAAVAEVRKTTQDSEINDLKEMVKNLSLTVENMSSQMKQLTKNNTQNQNTTSQIFRPQIATNVGNLVCFGCGQEGHFKRECPLRNQRNPPTGVAVNIPNRSFQSHSRGNLQSNYVRRGQLHNQNYNMGGSRNFVPDRGSLSNNPNNFPDRRGENFRRGINNRGRFNRNSCQRENFQSGVNRPSDVEETSPKHLNY